MGFLPEQTPRQDFSAANLFVGKVEININTEDESSYHPEQPDLLPPENSTFSQPGVAK